MLKKHTRDVEKRTMKIESGNNQIVEELRSIDVRIRDNRNINHELVDRISRLEGDLTQKESISQNLPMHS